MRVADVMQRAVLTCTPHMAASEPARIMASHHVGCVPVVNDELQPIAMVTDRDLCLAAYRSGKALSELRVLEAMSGGIFTCRDNAPLREAERTMRDWKIRRLPVVDERGVLRGILSLSDLALAYDRSHMQGAFERIFGDLGETLIALARPRD